MSEKHEELVKTDCWGQNFHNGGVKGTWQNLAQNRNDKTGGKNIKNNYFKTLEINQRHTAN